MNLKIFLVFFFSTLILFILFYSFVLKDSQQNRDERSCGFTYVPHVEIPAVSESDTIYRYTGFSLQYAEQYEQAYWVAYMHCKAKMTQVAKRTNSFIRDPHISTKSASASDYKKTGYDRGHLAPAGDMKWDKMAMKESFYFSNICPQTPKLNRGVWKKIEDKVRYWVEQYDTLYVITGPILHEKLGAIGENKVAVPEYFFKIILLYSSTVQDAVGFVVPNTFDVEEDMIQFLVSVDSVESVTNISFFMQISDSVRKKIKKNTSIAHWN